MEQRYAFILRIWQHAPATADAAAQEIAHDPELGEVRGTLQAFDAAHVQHFSSLRDLEALLHTILSTSSGEHSSPSKGAAPSE